MWEAGEPLDQAVFTRFISLLPIKVAEFFSTRALNSRFDHELFSVRPQHSLLSQHGMINDDLPHRIITGSIVVKPNVSHFTKTGVVFDDGSELCDVDCGHIVRRGCGHNLPLLLLFFNFKAPRLTTFLMRMRLLLKLAVSQICGGS